MLSKSQLTQKPIRLIVFGSTGVGKSSAMNYIISGDREIGPFKVGEGYGSETQKCTKVAKTIEGQEFELIDTPGFYDTDNPNETIIKKVLAYVKELDDGLNFAFFCISVAETRIDANMQHSFRLIKHIMGKNAFSQVAILGTQFEMLSQEEGKKRLKMMKEQIIPVLAKHDIVGLHKQVFSYDKGPEGREVILKYLKRQQKRFMPDLHKQINDLGIIVDPNKPEEAIDKLKKESKNFRNMMNEMEEYHEQRKFSLGKAATMGALGAGSVYGVAAGAALATEGVAATAASVGCAASGVALAGTIATGVACTAGIGLVVGAVGYGIYKIFSD